MGKMEVLSVTGAAIVGSLFMIGLIVEPKTPEQRVAEIQKHMADGADQMMDQRVHNNVIFKGYEIDGNMFTYKYTLTHIRNGRYNGADKIRIQEMMHKQVCGDRKMKKYLRADGVVRYSYNDRDGGYLFVIGFDDAICGLT